MKIKELIERLSGFDPEQEVMVLDGFNGGGAPRTINLGPVAHAITRNDEIETGDCEERFAEEIALIGYGCY